MKTKKRKILIGVLIAVPLLLILAAICFFQFDGAGYRMSVPYRSGYTEISPHVYVSDGCKTDRETLLSLCGQARERVSAFFGEIQSDPVIIFSDDAAGSRLGGDHDTKTMLSPVKQSYISVTDKYCELDILAHEMTHAELHKRLNFDRLSDLPTWFDEGIATQNDYRAQYSAEEWEKQTDSGKTAVMPADMDTPAEFYAGTADDRRFRYLCAKHEVAVWLDENGREGLLTLIDRLNSGSAFADAFQGS